MTGNLNLNFIKKKVVPELSDPLMLHSYEYMAKYAVHSYIGFTEGMGKIDPMAKGCLFNDKSRFLTSPLIFKAFTYGWCNIWELETEDVGNKFNAESYSCPRNSLAKMWRIVRFKALWAQHAA